MREREKTIKGDSKKPLSNVDAVLVNEVWIQACVILTLMFPDGSRSPLAADTRLIVRLLRLIKMCCEPRPRT